ncbi:MAG: sulfatase-like hydrolase/transferase, partial [Myxococcota bacterium]|nr:sulfatase-like hydrolase/transferase [Myxococcota bacterium]
SEAPWFMVLHGYDAHRPFVGPAPFHHLFGEGGGSVIAETIVKHGSETERVYDRVYYPNSSMKWFWHPSGIQILEPEVYERVRVASAMTEGIALTDDDVEHIQAHYDSMVAYADLQLGLFFSAAERSGYLDNTIVIVTGDHGEDLLDHKYVNHRTALTDSCIRVPMIVMGPGFPSGARSTAMVDALDLVPTILEASGAAPPAGLSGQSLQDSVDGQGSETVFVEGVLNMTAVRTRSHKLIYSGTPLKTDGYEDRLAKAALTGGSFELYDVTSDPGELHDRLASPEAEDLALAEDLRVQLVAWRRSIQRGTHRGDPEAVDPRLRKEMQEHGYWEMGEDQSADPGEDQPAETTEAGDEP